MDVPEEHFMFYGPMIFHQAGSAKELTTKRVLELNRMSLIDKRKDRLEQLMPLIELWKQGEPGAFKEALRQQILEECELDKESSLMVEYFVRQQPGLAV